MAGSTFGDVFRITTFGESHGKGLGVVIDGCPAGLIIDEDYIMSFLDRRKPGQNPYTTARKEGDSVEILSGVYKGLTTGTPISMLIRNTDQHSGDYSLLTSCYRPGHADYTFEQKYGIRDPRGGGRSSGRETVSRVAAGAVASAILKELGITIMAYTAGIGGINIDKERADADHILSDPLYMPDPDASKRAAEEIDKARSQGDSLGGVVECIIKGMPAGIGETVFDKLDAQLAKAVMSIGAVKAVEIGDGTAVTGYTGLEDNDPFIIDNGRITKETNHAGGILGGMSDGSEIILRAHIKPTPSISATQRTVNVDGEEMDLNIKGRHDPVIVPRAVVVVESMAAVTVVDLLLRNMCSRMENLKKIYS